MMDLYQDDEESRDAGVPTPHLEPASVLGPIPTTPIAGPGAAVSEPCIPTSSGIPESPTLLLPGPCSSTSPGILESLHAAQEDSDDDEDIWAKAHGRGSAEKVGRRKSTMPTTEQLMAKAVGKVAAAAVSAALATGVHCTRATGHAAAVPAAAAPSQQSSTHQGVLQAPLPATSPQAPSEPSSVAREPVAASSKPGKQRAPRGTAGTFAGRRPPTNPEKLQVFNAAREAHLANKRVVKQKREMARFEGQETQLEASPDQRAYWKHLKEAMQGTGDLPGAVNTYCSPKKTAGEKRRFKRPAGYVGTPTKRYKYVISENGTVDQEPEPLQS